MPKPVIDGSGIVLDFGAPGDGAGVGYDWGPRPGERCSQSLNMFIAGADVFICD